MLTVDKELSSGKFKINVVKSDYLPIEFIVYLFRFWNVLLIYIAFFFFTFLTVDIRDLKSRLGQTAKALGLVSPFNTKKCFSRLDQLNWFLPFVLIWAMVNLNVKFACSDVNVIPNLSIVPKKLVMVTLKLSELHSENRPILPCKQRFLSCMAFSVLA